MRSTIEFKPFLTKLLKLSSINLLFLFLMRSSNKIVIISNTLVLQVQITSFAGDNATLAMSLIAILAHLSVMTILDVVDFGQYLEIVHAFVMVFLLAIYEFGYHY